MGDATRPSLAGLRDAGRQVLAGLVDIGHTRLELAAVELEEQRLHLARQWVALTCTMFLLFVTVMLGAAAIVLSFEAADRLRALIVLTSLFAVAAIAGGWHWRRLARTRPPLLHATLSELSIDRHQLLDRSSA